MEGDPELDRDVLHVLRVKYRPAAGQVADRLGADVTDVGAALDQLAAEGLVVHRDGRTSGWALTEAGQASHAEALAAWRMSTSMAPLQAAYEAFLRLNVPFKRLCTDHQLGCRPEEVRRRLAPLDAQLRALIARASGPCPRMATYLAAFAAAYARIHAGDLDALTRPLSGSYHDVWMELHQDLLVTLGRDRGEHDE